MYLVVFWNGLRWITFYEHADAGPVMQEYEIQQSRGDFDQWRLVKVIGPWKRRIMAGK